MMAWPNKIVIVMIISLFSIAIALANPLGVDEVERIESSRFNDTITPQSIQAQAGNVSELSISAVAVTRTWQGFYGNITGQLILADSSGNNFYDWNVTSPSGQVYASRNDSISWTGVTCLSGARIEDEEAYLGRTTTDPDSVTNTFTDTNHPSFLVGTQSISGCPTTQAYGSGGSQSGEFWQVLLDDPNQNTIYTTLIQDIATQGFNERPWHFQLLVGENGHPGNEGTTTYYFYVELN